MSTVRTAILDYAKNVLSNQATFQELVGATDADGAATRIYTTETDDRNQMEAEPPPKCLIGWKTELSRRRTGVGSRRERGTLELRFDVLVSDEFFQDQRGAIEWFEEQLSLVAYGDDDDIDGIEQLGEQGDPAGNQIWLYGSEYRVGDASPMSMPSDDTPFMIGDKVLYSGSIEVDIGE